MESSDNSWSGGTEESRPGTWAVPRHQPTAVSVTAGLSEKWFTSPQPQVQRQKPLRQQVGSTVVAGRIPESLSAQWANGHRFLNYLTVYGETRIILFSVCIVTRSPSEETAELQTINQWRG